MTIVVDSFTLVKYSRPSMSPFYVGKLELDIDPLSERHIVTDRLSGETLFAGKNDINVHYVNAKYALNPNLLVTILDDDREFNAVTVDGVTCELIDLAIL